MDVKTCYATCDGIHDMDVERATTSSPCSARDAKLTVNWLVRPAASATPLQRDNDIQMPFQI